MFGANPYVSKSPVVGTVVAVLRGVTDSRGLYLEMLRSRAVRQHDIHELMITDESAALESTVNRVALLVFFEVTDGGVILEHDRVMIDATEVGTVAGFDETHMPNHQNICLRGVVADGETLALQVGQRVVIQRA